MMLFQTSLSPSSFLRTAVVGWYSRGYHYNKALLHHHRPQLNTTTASSFPHSFLPRRGLAGHNKWSKIKRKKGTKDVARSGAFAKASRAITAAARACGGDTANLQLQSAIQHAKNIQLPKDRIKDAIERGAAAVTTTSNTKGGPDLSSLRYDAMISFGGQKVACIITALSDNRNRTASTVRSTVTRSGGELLPSNSHSFLFQYKGFVLLENISAEEEDGLMECALEGGANEIDFEDSVAAITCESSDLWNLVKSLQGNGYQPTEFDQRYMLADQSNAVSLDEEGQEKLEAFLDKMNDDMDVENVYHNAIEVQKE